jgi:hypothetical protein
LFAEVGKRPHSDDVGALMGSRSRLPNPIALAFGRRYAGQRLRRADKQYGRAA